MGRIFLIILASLISSLAFSQGQKKIWGKVIDSKNQEPLENVSIYIKDGNQGTFSNEQGEFVFNFDGSNSSIIFQIIGFKPLEYKPKSEEFEELLITLDQDPFFLDEVIVRADSSLNIMTKAFASLKKNYPDGQHLLKGYYRESVLKDDSYVRFLDAAIGINDFSYKSDHLRRKIQVYNMRKSEDYVEESLMTKVYKKIFTDNNKFLIFLNLHDIIRRYHKNPFYFKGINKDVIDFFNFKMDTVLQNGGSIVAKIAYNAPTAMNKTDGFFYVNLDDFAIIRFDMTRSFSDRLTKDAFLKKASKSINIVEYKKVNDRYFLSRFVSEGAENFAALNEHTKTGTQVLKMELWINEVFDNKRFFEKIKNKYKLDWETELKDLDIPYDLNFWNSFNYIPDSMEYSKMVRDLKKLNQNE